MRNIGKKVLLIAASHTGNNIFCTPAVKFLHKHYPDTVFDLVALNKKSAEVFLGNPIIRRLMITDSPRVIKKMADDYATIICLYSKSVEMVEDVRGNVFTPPALTSGIHHAEQVLQFVSQVTGIAITDEDRHYMTTGSQATEAGGPIKDQAGKNDRLICMHLGCAQTSIHGWKWFYSKRAHHQKLWPIDHYIGLAELLIKNEPRLRFVITGTKNETFLGKQFEKRIPGTINLIGKTSVTQLFDLMHGIDFSSRKTVAFFTSRLHPMSPYSGCLARPIH